MKIKDSIKISDKELFNISPIRVDFEMELLRGSKYYFFNFSGYTERGGANNVLLYLDEKSLDEWIYWYKNILKQTYLRPPQFQLTGHTSYPNINKRSVFGEDIGVKIIIKHIKTNKIMNTIQSLIKKIARKEPEKTFVSVGFLDENENITEEGKEALVSILWDKNKEELKALADKLDAETKTN